MVQKHRDTNGEGTKRKSKGLLFMIVGVALFVITLMLVLKNNSRNHYDIPQTVAKDLDFPVLFIKKPVNGYTLDKSSIKLATQPDGSKVFSFIAEKGSAKITYAEQAYPEILIYDKLTNSINPYSEVGTIYGKLTLGRPADSNGAQVGVLKYGDSTLVFAKPSQDINETGWKSAINSLEEVK